MYTWLVFFHIVTAFLFVLAHGASAAVALALRSQREPERVRALLELSKNTLGVMVVSLLLALGTGIWAGFKGGAGGMKVGSGRPWSCWWPLASRCRSWGQTTSTGSGPRSVCPQPTGARKTMLLKSWPARRSFTPYCSRGARLRYPPSALPD